MIHFKNILDFLSGLYAILNLFQCILKGSYTKQRLSISENSENHTINEATMVTLSKLKGGIFTFTGSETAQNDR